MKGKRKRILLLLLRPYTRSCFQTTGSNGPCCWLITTLLAVDWRPLEGTLVADNIRNTSQILLFFLGINLDIEEREKTGNCKGERDWAIASLHQVKLSLSLNATWVVVHFCGDRHCTVNGVLCKTPPKKVR